MMWVTKAVASSIGTKVVMALTGAVLVLFVIGHMLGNLQVFLGPEALNSYAKKLKDLGGLLWVVRLGLLTVFVVHILAALKLQTHNSSSRPIGYQSRDFQQASAASRYMLHTGMVVLGFVILHLIHFTFLAWPGTDFASYHDALGRHDVYRMVVTGFSSPGMVAIYVVCNLFVGFHLWHGASSMFQTLGLNHPRYRFLTRGLGPCIATIIIVGNLAIPLACFFGLVAPVTMTGGTGS